jgi:hypothetical protein
MEIQMNLNEQLIERLNKALRLETPIIALYDTDPTPGFEPLVHSKGRACCFAYYQRWLKGETLVIERNGGSFQDPKNGCPGMHNAFGFGKGYPPWMANFLTDGKGAPMGEGLKATPQLAQEFLDRAKAPTPTGDHILIGPLRLEHWDKVRTISFFVDPDRLAALMTLATFWSSNPDEIAAPFSSGCGLMWREMISFDRDRPIIGCTDIAMRKYLPPEILCISVSPARFEQMINFPDDAFLKKEWWNELLKSREKSANQ